MNLLKQVFIFCFITLSINHASAVIVRPHNVDAPNSTGALQITATHSGIVNASASKKTWRQRLKERLRPYYGNRIGGLLILGFVFLLAGAIILTAGLTSGNSSALGYGAVFAGIGLLIILVLSSNRGGGGGPFRRRF